MCGRADVFDRLEIFWRELVRRRVVHVAGVYAWIAVYMVATTYEVLFLFRRAGAADDSAYRGSRTSGNTAGAGLLVFGLLLATGSFLAVADRLILAGRR